MFPPWPQGAETAVFGMGCFWGAERLFWKQAGVYTTVAGYCGGHVFNPTYEQICTGTTGHAEVIRAVFNPAIITYDDLLTLFWQNHNPTQGMRQGNDTGSQYRSCIFVMNDLQQRQAEESRHAYQKLLTAEEYPDEITTEIKPMDAFYYAEEYHQQYLAKNPDGYCGLNGTGVLWPTSPG